MLGPKLARSSCDGDAKEAFQLAGGRSSDYRKAVRKGSEQVATDNLKTCMEGLASRGDPAAAFAQARRACVAQAKTAFTDVSGETSNLAFQRAFRAGARREMKAALDDGITRQIERLNLRAGRKASKAQFRRARQRASRDAKASFLAAGGTTRDFAREKARAARDTVRDAFEDCVTAAVEEMPTADTNFAADGSYNQFIGNIAAYWKLDKPVAPTPGTPVTQYGDARDTDPVDMTASRLGKTWDNPNAGAKQKAEPFSYVKITAGKAAVGRTHGNGNNYVYIGTHGNSQNSQLYWRFDIVNGGKIGFRFKVGNFKDVHQRKHEVHYQSGTFDQHGHWIDAGSITLGAENKVHNNNFNLPMNSMVPRPSFNGRFFLRCSFKMLGAGGHDKLVGWSEISFYCTDCDSFKLVGEMPPYSADRPGPVLSLGPASTRGRIGQGAKFDGTNALCAKGLSLNADVPTWTVQAWFRTSTKSTAKMCVVCGNDVPGGNKAHFISVENGKVIMSLQNDNLLGGTRVNDNKWHHAVVVKSFSFQKLAELFLDGELVDTLTPVQESLAWAKLSIGGYWGCQSNANGQPVEHGFVGAIDEVAVWKTRIYEPTIEKLYNFGQGLQYGASGPTVAQRRQARLACKEDAKEAFLASGGDEKSFKKARRRIADCGVCSVNAGCVSSFSLQLTTHSYAFVVYRRSRAGRRSARPPRSRTALPTTSTIRRRRRARRLRPRARAASPRSRRCSSRRAGRTKASSSRRR